MCSGKVQLQAGVVKGSCHPSLIYRTLYVGYDMDPTSEHMHIAYNRYICTLYKVYYVYSTCILCTMQYSA